MQNRINNILALAFAGAMALALWLALREQPVAIDLAVIGKGPMEVAIEEEGVARVRDVYVVSSPIAGHLDRTTLEEGDAVKANETVIASIHPLEPPFLDERARTEAAAAVQAARAAVALAQVEMARAQTARNLAQSEYHRALQLTRDGVVPQARLEEARNALELADAQVDSAQAQVRLREAELQSALARVKQPGDMPGSRAANADCCIRLTAPVDGVVLRVLARSEQAVTPGSVIAEVGDPARLEIAVDLLSADAPRIAPGAPARITGWGGDEELLARVRRIDPAAFTKVSSLGIEEQRVNAILDIDNPPPALGHEFRVIARLVIWSGEDVLQVPVSALFRSGGDWAVFAVEGDRARLKKVGVGRMNDRHAQIVSGLAQGDEVIVYPNDLLEDGSPVERRLTQGREE
jgi:HlyD family secretion protein